MSRSGFSRAVGHHLQAALSRLSEVQEPILQAIPGIRSRLQDTEKACIPLPLTANQRRSWSDPGGLSNFVGEYNVNMGHGQRAVALLVVLVATVTAHAQVPAQPAKRPPASARKTLDPPFRVFDALLYMNRPSFEGIPFRPIRLIYGSALWAPKASMEQPDEARVRDVAKGLGKMDAPVIIDIEHWDVKGDDASAHESITKYIRVIDLMRTECPELKFGYYATLPIRDYWSVVGNRPAQLKAWQKNNRRLQELADHVDAVFPSLYTFYPDEAGWKVYAKQNLQEARRYKKPVYAFLWPEYHDSNKELAGKNIPGKFWAAQLRLCRREADGIIIWGGYKKDWDPTAEWWKETEAFLRDLK